MKRVLLTTGGTGGHIFPALAVAEELRRQYENIQILFMGSLQGPEKRLAEKAHVNYVGLPVRGVLGRGPAALVALARLVMALPKARRIIQDFAPDCAAGFGSYAAFAPLCAARMLHIPSILHEQNAVAGASNRVLARFCDRICTSLPDTTGFEDRPVVQTGNPVRSSIWTAGQNRSFDLRPDGLRHLLVMGGSQGAHAINMALVDLLPELKEANIAIWHQTGEADAEEVRASYECSGLRNFRVEPFFDNMAEVYAWADLALCRAGASTVSELCAAALPSILVPFPHAIHDHQTRNAVAMEKAGAAKVIPQKDMTHHVLLAELKSLLRSMEIRSSMSASARCLASPEAAANVVTQMREAVETRAVERKQKKA